MTQEQHKYYSNGYDDGKQSTGDQYLKILLKKDQEIERLKAENSKMRIVLQAIQKWANKLLTGQPNPPEAAEAISDIEVIATEALKPTP